MVRLSLLNREVYFDLPNCSKCGKEVSEGVKLCPQCGTEVPKQKSEVDRGLRYRDEHDDEGDGVVWFG